MRLGAPLALALACAPAVAAANGRSPQTNGAFTRPADSQSIYARSTFGLLVSTDNGCTFRWVCERAIGYGGDFDPKYAIASDGTIYATTFKGLRISRDNGCSWVTATQGLPTGDPGNISGIWIDALDISPTGEVWVATAESGQPNDVLSSLDAGMTFQPRGLRSMTVWWKSVRVARSNPLRVYLAGYQVAGVLPDGGQAAPQAHLMRTDDGGTTWNELVLKPSELMFAATPIVLVAAVDPAQPDALLLTSVAANGRGDRLYRTTDAGNSFQEVLATPDPIRDVVYAADGTVYVAAASGSFKSTDRGATFQPLTGAPQLGCLAQRSDGTLIGCGANWDPDFKAVATSSNGSTWNKVFRFVELAGPIQCPSGTPSADLCDPLWPALQQQFGATGSSCSGPTDPPTPAKTGGGCCDGGASDSAGLALAIGWLALGRRRRS